jgi:hypothetical protein
MYNIKVRYNTNYGVLPNQKRWRVLVNGEQTFADHIEIKVPTQTTDDIVIIDGVFVEKNHISCKARYVKQINLQTSEFIDGNDFIQEHLTFIITDDINDSGLYNHLLNVAKNRLTWSEKKKKWKVYAKDDFVKNNEQIIEHICDSVSINGHCWTSLTKPEICFNADFNK